MMRPRKVVYAVAASRNNAAAGNQFSGMPVSPGGSRKTISLTIVGPAVRAADNPLPGHPTGESGSARGNHCWMWRREDVRPVAGDAPRVEQHAQEQARRPAEFGDTFLEDPFEQQQYSTTVADQ